MKFKVSKREIMKQYHYIIRLGYCSGQFLLYYEEPIAYSTRTEGWACDYYDIDGVLISTGYAPLEAKNTTYDYDTLQAYEKQAEQIHCGDGSWEERRNKVRALLRKFVKSTLQEAVR